MKNVIYLLAFAFLVSCSQNKKENNTNLDIITQNKSISDGPKIQIDSAENKIVKLEKSHRFEEFKVEVYQGKLAEPNFVGNPFANDKEYVEFISNGCKKNQVNFGGHYTIIGLSCGAECSQIFIIDRKDGRIFTEIKPNDGRYGYEYRKDSELLIANSSLFIDDKFEKYLDYWCKPEFYKWKNNNFTNLE